MAAEFFDRIGDNTFIYPSVEVYIENRQPDGRGLSIGTDCIVFPRTRFVLGDMSLNKHADIQIGDDVQIGPGCYISAEGGVYIGNLVMVGANVNILSSSHNYVDAEIPVKWQGMLYGKVSIGDDVVIGAGSVIQRGISIGRGAVVTAGSVVLEDIPEFGIVAGNPARLIEFRGENGVSPMRRFIKKISGFFRK